MANCSECVYLDFSNPDLYGKGWCEKKLERVDANEYECYRFCRAYNRSSSVSRSYEEYSKNNSNDPGCYLTTMLCYILKMPDSNPFLNTMRSFRNNILQKNDNYKPLLVEYDIIGPQIAKNLYNDPLKYQIAVNSFAKYIKPITKLIKEKKYNEAISLYIEMTNTLKKFYNINITLEENIIENADLEKSGHGIYTLKKSLN